MKRPFAVTGFTMLFASLLLYRMTFKETAIVLCITAVSFCILLPFKRIRSDMRVHTALLAVMLLSGTLLCAECRYVKTGEELNGGCEITATVLEAPLSDDYMTSYVLKVDSVNGKKQSFKIKYFEKEGKSFVQGDRVAGKVEFADSLKYPDLFFNSLSNGIYFTAFESDDGVINKTGEPLKFYKLLGFVKNYFVDTTRRYLPGENGKIANAMVIGERSGVSERTTDMFNYSGTSHLLVVSGLHLTMWSVGIMEIMNKSKRLRKFTVPLSFLSLLLYASLTGFSVSVIRAGAMVGGVLLGKLFSRGSDGLNSVGFALTFILLFNPFASYSVALWLSVMSTTGLLTCSGKMHMYLIYSAPLRPVSHFWLVRKTAEALSVSVPVTAFTLPVFIVKFGLLPIASFIANFLMVPAGMLLMILTVLGMLLHLVGLRFLASGVYFLVGLTARFMRAFAEKIAMSEWSTVSVSHRYFTYFFVFALLVLLSAAVFRYFGKNLLKLSAVSLSVLFVLTCVYCASYDRNTPSADVIASGDSLSIVLNSGRENVYIGGDIEPYTLKRELNRHNAKILKTAVITDENLISAEKIKARVPIENTVNCADFKGVTVDGKIKADLSHYKSYIVLCRNGKSVLIIMPKAQENPFENGQKYDIMIAYGTDCEKYGGYASEIYKMSDGESLDIYWESRNGAYLRSRT